MRMVEYPGAKDDKDGFKRVFRLQDPELLKRLGEAKTLRTLIIRCVTTITTSTIAAIVSKLENLETLDLSSCVPKEGDPVVNGSKSGILSDTSSLSFLADHKKLKAVIMNGYASNHETRPSPATDAALKALAQSKTITHISLDNAELISLAAIRSLSNMEQLTSLSMYSVSVEGNLSDTLTAFANLVSLSIDARAGRNDVDVGALYRMPKLKRLQIEVLSYSILANESIGQSGLTELDVTCYPGDGWSEVTELARKLSKLRSLRLYPLPESEKGATEENNFRSEIEKVRKTLELRLVRR